MSESRWSPNYLYWRREGYKWRDEYDRRKSSHVIYHIQELMLLDYLSHSVPATVLDFGCGIGRHLHYLSRLPGLKVYGFDQSPAMVDATSQWFSNEWIEQHIKVGDPVGRLPYPDKSFDITFTSEVLIHINPADLPVVLAELVRITRWQVLHLEPSPETEVIQSAHDGCWNHDLVGEYQKLQRVCEILPSGMQAQTPFRVVLDRERIPYAWSDLQLALLRRLEADLQPTLTRAAEVTENLHSLEVAKMAITEQLESVRAQLAAERKWVDDLGLELRAQRRKTAELDEANQLLQTQIKLLLRQVESEEASAVATRRLLEDASIALGVDAPNQIAQRATLTMAELDFLRRSPALRLGTRIRRLSGAVFYRRLRYRHSLVRIRALASQCANSKGSQVWLLAIRTAMEPQGVPLAYLDYDASRWRVVADKQAPHGQVLMTDQTADLDIYAEVDTQLRLDFLMHDWSGHVSIESRESACVLDLYAETHTGISVFPFFAPMRVEPIARAEPGVANDVPSLRPAPKTEVFNSPLESIGETYTDLLGLVPRRFGRVYDAPALMSPQERVLLYGLVFALKPLRCLEIGTNRGGSASIIVAALDDLGGDSRLTCIDPNRLIESALWDTIRHRATFIQGGSPEALEGIDVLAGGPFDLVNIDGLHDYEHALADARGVLPLLADEAYVLFHDAYYSGVDLAVEHWLEDNPTTLTDMGILARSPNPERDRPEVVWGGMRVVRYMRKMAT